MDFVEIIKTLWFHSVKSAEISGPEVTLYLKS